MADFELISDKIKEFLSLDSDPAAVFLLSAGTDMHPFGGWKRLQKHRYCQALMKARRAELVILEAKELSCPAAAAAFGIRPLPTGLANGEALVGFGIVEKADTGRTMFENMPKLNPGSVECIALCSLADAPRVPDIVVVEGQVEKLMWILLADLNMAGGKRRTADTAVLQATCVDATIIPYKENRLNFSYGCYGCRDATDLGVGEAVLGFPGNMLEPLAKTVEYLCQRAIPRSRAKKAYQNLIESNAK
jgi:uncharacterized protein (DUF169 family)